MSQRDIVVIGSSAGGVVALPRVLQQLPADLPATIAIVQHLSPTYDAKLDEILARSGRLPVRWAEQGDRREPGHVVLAPPDTHLLFVDDHLVLVKSARENHCRPSIDKLFRSAAAEFGSRVIGVLLTGMLSDGVAGLRAIRDVGGAVIVQDPVDAAYPDLPRRALSAMTPDRTLPIDAIGAALVELVGTPVEARAIPPELAVEASFDRRGTVTPEDMKALGPLTSFNCPECNGSLWELGDPFVRRYRCFTGHTITARDLLDSQSENVESALWSAIRALGDRANTLESLQRDAEALGNRQAASEFLARAREAREQAELARKFMLDLAKPR